ncbi:COX15/CtaA family protein [Humitalea sp. 24SJ18S-53]|uniref:COX15/CtaA family protein n=1 Tax=Humitalea sp. 24SJ18S-53 TaxID=3422307 RepID=UPI003D66A637
MAIWLLTVCGLIWAMVAIGGATRLTGSGLSIMEWAPLSGILPPMSDAEWQRLYDLYRTVPQYALVNAGFGMEGFQRIFWLEWIHRFWGRMLGFAFAVPMLVFWVRGHLPRGLLPRLLLLLVLGGLQGGVGWFMVASGFQADRTSVSPYRLVLHLGLALVLFAFVFWTALDLLRPERTAPATAAPLRRLVHATAGLVVLTMLAGGFVAGLRAGLDFNTWPLMEGRLVPPGYLADGWHSMTHDIATVQFHHRLLATLAGFAALAATWTGLRTLAPGFARTALLALGVAVTVQYALGIATLLHAVPVGLGTLHQAVAVAVLAAVLAAMHGLRRGRVAT